MDGPMIATTKDEDLFQALAHVFTENFPGMSDRPCDSKTPSGVIHGADQPDGATPLADTVYKRFHTLMVIFSFQILHCYKFC